MGDKPNKKKPFKQETPPGQNRFAADTTQVYSLRRPGGGTAGTVLNPNIKEEKPKKKK